MINQFQVKRKSRRSRRVKLGMAIFIFISISIFYASHGVKQKTSEQVGTYFVLII